MLPPRAPDREETLPSGDATLHVEHYRPSGSPSWALVHVHGYAAHCGLYRHVAAALADRGIAVTNFDCRGHGRSSGRRGHVHRFGEYHADLARVIQSARERTPGTPVALMGHSHGGTIALEHVLDDAFGPRPDRLILAAPWLALVMAVPAAKRLAGRILGQIWPTLTLANGIRPTDVSRNELVVANFRKDPLVHHVATARWFVEVLGAQTRIRAAADRLTVPTLLLVAGQDRIVSSPAAVAFAAAAGPTVEVRTYPDLYHELFLEPEHGAVISDVTAWLLAEPPGQLAEPTESLAGILPNKP